LREAAIYPFAEERRELVASCRASVTHKQTVADYFMLPNFGRSFISVRMLMWDTAA